MRGLLKLATKFFPMEYVVESVEYHATMLNAFRPGSIWL